jgi:hypothetical protein
MAVLCGLFIISSLLFTGFSFVYNLPPPSIHSSGASSCESCHGKVVKFFFLFKDLFLFFLEFYWNNFFKKCKQFFFSIVRFLIIFIKNIKRAFLISAHSLVNNRKRSLNKTLGLLWRLPFVLFILFIFHMLAL